jgi:hypothetical protein
MSQCAFGIKTLTAGEALAAYRRVKLSSNTVVYSDAGENFIGITEDAAANGAGVAVGLLGGRTFKCVAAGAVTAGADIYGAADGKVDDAVVGLKIGVALEAALAANDVIEVLIDKDASESWS